MFLIIVVAVGVNLWFARRRERREGRRATIVAAVPEVRAR
jgi:hypothetical protein